MTQDHVRNFEKAQDQLLAQRRSLAEALAGGYKTRTDGKSHRSTSEGSGGNRCDHVSDQSRSRGLAAASCVRAGAGRPVAIGDGQRAPCKGRCPPDGEQQADVDLSCRVM
jgi:hypothetical protein